MELQQKTLRPQSSLYKKSNTKPKITVLQSKHTVSTQHMSNNSPKRSPILKSIIQIKTQVNLNNRNTLILSIEKIKQEKMKQIIYQDETNNKENLLLKQQIIKANIIKESRFVQQKVQICSNKNEYLSSKYSIWEEPKQKIRSLLVSSYISQCFS